MPLLQLHLTTWPDQLLEKRGYPADSGYVEAFWLPVLGPSATFLFRRLNVLLEAFPEGMTTEMNELGRELGLGTSDSKHSPLQRAISRLVRFGLVRRSASGQLAVRRAVGPLSQHLVHSLPPFLQEAHEEVISRARACDPDLPATGPSPTRDLKAG
jgi:hypothetical protein